MTTGFKPDKYSGFIGIGGIDEYHDTILSSNNRWRKITDIMIRNDRFYCRPGFRPWSDQAFPNGIQGVFEYLDILGNSNVIVLSGYEVYLVTKTTKTLIDTVTSDELHFMQFKGDCYYNGNSTQRKYNGTISSDVGLDAPTTKPTVTAGAAPGLTGSYVWVYTFVIEEDGVCIYESNPSPLSDSTDISNTKVTITPGISLDSRINARYIYRSQASGSTYWYEGKISNNTAGQTFSSGTIADADITYNNSVEYTHTKPQQAEYSVVCNDLIFWLKGTKLRYSEIGLSKGYKEYSPTINEFDLSLNGTGKGLVSLYNPNTGKEDLYVFTDNSVLVVAGGDPATRLLTISNNIGCVQHDTIRKYNGKIIFYSNNNSIYMLAGGTLLDISQRSIPVTLGKILKREMARAEIVFNHYYALSVHTDATHEYNDYVLLVDLRSVVQITNDTADANWFTWKINAEYLLQLSNGTLLMFDTYNGAIFELNINYINDQSVSDVTTPIQPRFRTVDLEGQSLFVKKQPRLIQVAGKFEKGLTIIPYYFISRVGSSAQIISGKSFFVMGSSKMGDKISDIPILSPAQIPREVVGNNFSFEFTKTEDDLYFEFAGYEYTFVQFLGGL
jgi:hypothetical protein